MCIRDSLGTASFMASFVPGLEPTGDGVELTGHAEFTTMGLILDGEGDRATITTGEYASDASFSVGFWFAKTQCNDLAQWWEYLYSHNEFADQGILTDTNDNVNLYMGCDTGMGGGGAQMGGQSAVWTDGADHGVSGSFIRTCLLYTSPSPRDQRGSRMPSSA